jgi:hypothetical protein
VAEARSGEDAAAIADLEQSIKLDPDRFDTYEALDGVLSKGRQWATVVQYWTQYIELHPNDGRAYCERGGAYSWLHDAAHMLADADRACSLGNQPCCQYAQRLRARQAPSEKPRPAAPTSSSGEQAPAAPSPAMPSGESSLDWGVLLPVASVFLPVVLLLFVVPIIRRSKPYGTLDYPEVTPTPAPGISPGSIGKRLNLATQGSVLDRPRILWRLYTTNLIIIVVSERILVAGHLLSKATGNNMIVWLPPAVLGVYLFTRGFVIYREFRGMVVTPESPIQGLAMGFAEVHGKATGAQTLPSPVSKTPCLFYMVIVECRGMSGGFCTFSRMDRSDTSFYLEDATGKVRVNPAGLECDLLVNKEIRLKVPRSWMSNDQERQGVTFSSPQDELIDYAYRLAGWEYIKGRVYLTECHFLEYCVLPGHWYDLTGRCVENPRPQDEQDRNLIVKGKVEDTFLISWRSEKGIKARVGSRAVYDIYVGGALILLGAALGLASCHLL